MSDATASAPRLSGDLPQTYTLPADEQDRLVLVRDLASAVPAEVVDPLAPERAVLRDRNGYLLLAEIGAGDNVVQIGPAVQSRYCDELAHRILMSEQRAMTEPVALRALALRIAELVGKVEALRMYLVRVQSGPPAGPRFNRDGGRAGEGAAA